MHDKKFTYDDVMNILLKEHEIYAKESNEKRAKQQEQAEMENIWKGMSQLEEKP